jgi:hypothetical protein
MAPPGRSGQGPVLPCARRPCASSYRPTTTPPPPARQLPGRRPEGAGKGGAPALRWAPSGGSRRLSASRGRAPTARRAGPRLGAARPRPPPPPPARPLLLPIPKRRERRRRVRQDHGLPGGNSAAGARPGRRGAGGRCRGPGGRGAPRRGAAAPALGSTPSPPPRPPPPAAPPPGPPRARHQRRTVRRRSPSGAGAPRSAPRPARSAGGAPPRPPPLRPTRRLAAPHRRHRRPARPRFKRDTSLVLVTHGLALRVFLMRWCAAGKGKRTRGVPNAGDRIWGRGPTPGIHPPLGPTPATLGSAPQVPLARL